MSVENQILKLEWNDGGGQVRVKSLRRKAESAISHHIGNGFVPVGHNIEFELRHTPVAQCRIIAME
jgi:hypothetical protein